MRKYQIILADPPWAYNDQGCQGTMANHYKGMKLKDICNLSINSITDKNCILFMWATYPMLKEALQVIETWGFVYKSIAFQWVKLNPKSRTPFYGLGRWTRGNTEPCLLATKGKPKRISSSVFQLVQESRSGHSKKPQEVRKRIVELMGDLPRIELFARGKRDKDLFGNNKFDGWDIIGNDISGKDIREELEELCK